MDQQVFLLSLPVPRETHPQLSIRPEYALMASEVDRYARGFGFEMTRSQYQDISLLSLAIEKIDQAFDECDDPSRRRRLTRQITRRLAGKGRRLDGGGELCWVVSHLCGMVRRRGLGQAYAGFAHKIFECGERKRRCTRKRDFVETLLRESDLMVEFLLCILEPPAGFGEFARGLARTTNLLDDLLDMNDDYQRGSQELKPGPGLYGAILAAALTSAVATFRAYPSKLVLLRSSMALVPWVGSGLRLFSGEGPVKVRVRFAGPERASA